LNTLGEALPPPTCKESIFMTPGKLHAGGRFRLFCLATFPPIGLLGCTAAPTAKTELPLAVQNAQNCSPRYPAEAKRLGQQGKVTVRVLVNKTGKVSKTEVRTTSGFPLLDAAALDSLNCMAYVPGTVGGVPTSMWVDAPMNFVLDASRRPTAAPGTFEMDYGTRVALAVRRNIRYLEEPAGNPAAEFRLKLSSDGRIVERTLTKSSGAAGWDQAALVAIDKTGRLPLDMDGKVPPTLDLVMRPKE
jgi:TonB family protein